MQEESNLIKEEISNGDLDAAIDMALKLALPEPFRNMILHFAFRKNRTSKFLQTGQISFEEYTIQENRVAYYLLETLSEIAETRAASFLTNLVDKKFTLNDALAKDTVFVHAFTQTFNKVLNTNRQEKIEMLANLLKNTFSVGNPVNADEYDSQLNVLDSLTFTEIQLIVLLYKFESKFSIQETTAKNRLKQNVQSWSAFHQLVQTELAMNREECEAYLIGIEKSGLIDFPRPQANSMASYGACTTILFRKLYSRISNDGL